MRRHETQPELTLEDLAQIVCGGNIEGELQDRVAAVIRTDPRFARQFEELEALAADCGAEDLWEGLERNEEFDRLLAAESWDDPADIVNPEGSDLYEVSYRKLLAVAKARIAHTGDPGPIEAVRDNLLLAEKKPARAAAFQVAEALKHLSIETAETVIAEVRREHWRTERTDGD